MWELKTLPKFPKFQDLIQGAYKGKDISSNTLWCFAKHVKFGTQMVVCTNEHCWPLCFHLSTIGLRLRPRKVQLDNMRVLVQWLACTPKKGLKKALESWKHMFTIDMNSSQGSRHWSLKPHTQHSQNKTLLAYNLSYNESNGKWWMTQVSHHVERDAWLANAPKWNWKDQLYPILTYPISMALNILPLERRQSFIW